MDCSGQRLALDSCVVVDLRESETLAQRILGGSADEDLDVDLVALGGDLLPGWYDDWIVFERERSGTSGCGHSTPCASG